MSITPKAPTNLLRFTRDEVDLLPGVAEEDLDWVALSWVVERTIGGAKLYATFVLGPGFSLDTELLTKEEPLGRLGDYNLYIRGNDSDNMLTEPLERTSNLLSNGFQWTIRPFLCDFTGTTLQKEFKGTLFASDSASGIYETLGEVVFHGAGRGSRQSTLEHIAHTHRSGDL